MSHFDLTPQAISTYRTSGPAIAAISDGMAHEFVYLEDLGIDTEHAPSFSLLSGLQNPTIALAMRQLGTHGQLVVGEVCLGDFYPY